jgi:hypothetical protein
MGREIHKEFRAEKIQKQTQTVREIGMGSERQEINA